jgi:hypothetical protein
MEKKQTKEMGVLIHTNILKLQIVLGSKKASEIIALII